MKFKCKVCRRDVEINEADYNPGEKITVECDRCGNEIEVTIPEREDKTKGQPKIVNIEQTKPAVPPIPPSAPEEKVSSPQENSIQGEEQPVINTTGRKEG